MKKILTFILLFTSILFSQTNFWQHHSLNVPVWQLVKTSDVEMYAITDTNIFKYNNSGMNWEKIFTNNQSSNSSRPFKLEARKLNNQSTLLIVRPWKNKNFITQISTDGGITWTPLTKRFRDIAINNDGKLFCVGPSVYDSLYHPFIYRSTNFGTSWNTMYIGAPDTLKGDIEIDNSNCIYLTSTMLYNVFPDPFYFYYKHYLVRSDSSFVNWDTIFEITSQMSLGDLILIDSSDLILNVNYEILFHFSENTTSQYSSLHPINGGIIANKKLNFISSELYGISHSTDLGQTWFYENSGLPGNSTFSLVRDASGYIYTGTSNGVYKSSYPVVIPTTIGEMRYNIQSYWLSDSYPNPFNPTTTIEYQIPKTSNVKISLFNLVGEEIAVLVNEEKSQGKYKVEFNGANLSSGVYFYKMQAENFTSTKKFVLLK